MSPKSSTIRGHVMSQPKEIHSPHSSGWKNDYVKKCTGDRREYLPPVGYESVRPVSPSQKPDKPDRKLVEPKRRRHKSGDNGSDSKGGEKKKESKNKNRPGSGKRKGKTKATCDAYVECVERKGIMPGADDNQLASIANKEIADTRVTPSGKSKLYSDYEMAGDEPYWDNSEVPFPAETQSHYSVMVSQPAGGEHNVNKKADYEIPSTETWEDEMQFYDTLPAQSDLYTEDLFYDRNRSQTIDSNLPVDQVSGIALPEAGTPQSAIDITNTQPYNYIPEALSMETKEMTAAHDVPKGSELTRMEAGDRRVCLKSTDESDARDFHDDALSGSCSRTNMAVAQKDVAVKSDIHCPSSIMKTDTVPVVTTNFTGIESAITSEHTGMVDTETTGEESSRVMNIETVKEPTDTGIRSSDLMNMNMTADEKPCNVMNVNIYVAHEITDLVETGVRTDPQFQNIETAVPVETAVPGESTSLLNTEAGMRNEPSDAMDSQAVPAACVHTSVINTNATMAEKPADPGNIETAINNEPSNLIKTETPIADKPTNQVRSEIGTGDELSDLLEPDTTVKNNATKFMDSESIEKVANVTEIPMSSRTEQFETVVSEKYDDQQVNTTDSLAVRKTPVEDTGTLTKELRKTEAKTHNLMFGNTVRLKEQGGTVDEPVDNKTMKGDTRISHGSVCNEKLALIKTPKGVNIETDTSLLTSTPCNQSDSIFTEVGQRELYSSMPLTDSNPVLEIRVKSETYLDVHSISAVNPRPAAQVERTGADMLGTEINSATHRFLHPHRSEEIDHSKDMNAHVDLGRGDNESESNEEDEFKDAEWAKSDDSITASLPGFTGADRDTCSSKSVLTGDDKALQSQPSPWQVDGELEIKCDTSETNISHVHIQDISDYKLDHLYDNSSASVVVVDENDSVLQQVVLNNVQEANIGFTGYTEDSMGNRTVSGNVLQTELPNHSSRPMAQCTGNEDMISTKLADGAATCEQPPSVEDSEAKSNDCKINDDSTEANGANADTVTMETEEDDDSWDALFDEDGEALDPSVLEELTLAVGKVKVQKTQFDFYNFQPKDPDLHDDNYGHLIEIFDFPVEFKTPDLIVAFSEYKDKGFNIKWVDDTHAIGVFSSIIAAESALTMRHPLIKVRPISQATRQTKMKAKRCTEFLQPYKARPETTAAVARNLVTQSLGLRVPRESREKREQEKKRLKEAREKKRAALKQKKDAWEGAGSFGKCAMDTE